MISVQQKIRSAAPTFVPGAVALLAIVAPWLLTPGYLFFTDFIWGPNAEVRWQGSGFLAGAFMKLLGLVTPDDFAQKTFVTLALALVLIGGYRLAASMLEDRRLAAVLALFFLFNPFVYDRLGYGQVYLITSFGFFLLGTAALLRAYAIHDERRHLPFAGLWFALAIELSPHFLFLTALLALAWLTATLIRERSAWRRLVMPCLVAVLIVAAVNAHWVIGLASGGTALATTAAIGPADFEAFRTSGKTGVDAWLNVLTFSGFWGKDQFRYRDLTTEFDAWARSYLLLLPLVAWGVIAAFRDPKRRAIAWALAVAFCVAAFLAVGVRTDVGRTVTLWLAANLPAYAGMRETQKWVAVEIAAFGVFLAWGADRLFATSLVRRNRRVALAALAIVCVMQAPLLIGGMARSVRAVSYPDDWAQVDRLIADGGCQGTTLFLPWHLYMGFQWVGTIVANPAHKFFSCPIVSSSDPEWHGAADPAALLNADIVSAISGRGTGLATALAAHEARYVLLAKEGDWEKYDWLDTATEVKLVVETENLKLYEVQE